TRPRKPVKSDLATLIENSRGLLFNVGLFSHKEPGRMMKLDLHTHYYPESYFQMIRDQASEFSFDKDPTGRTIITHRGARFFCITPPMTDPQKRLEDMDRVGINTEVISLSTPNIFFADAARQP